VRCTAHRRHARLPLRCSDVLRGPDATASDHTLAVVYRPAAFAVDDASAVVAMIERAPLAHLVAVGPEGFEASPLPVLVDEHDGRVRVRGHVARPNPLWRLAPCRALLIVPLADAYVSPSWYATKSDGGKVVPTWNYEVVHAHGQLIAHDDVRWLNGFVRELTDRHEHTRTEPWSVDDAPVSFVDAMLRGIVGVELAVDRLEGKRKLSQNRSEQDRLGVIVGLEGEASTKAADVAAAMRVMDDIANT
jgi:transcriptional regulator